MTKISRDEIKVRGVKRLFNSIKYSMQGFAYAYKNEQSMLIHLFATIVGVLLGIVFRISFTEWMFIIIILGVTLAAEFINTAIEAAVDLCTLEVNPLAKIAKDCGSAATFVLSILGLVAGLFIFVPYIMALF